MRSHQATEPDEISLLARIARLLEILVRLNLETSRGDRKQSEMIDLLDSVGCGQTEIANLLGTTANTVNVALNRAKRKARKK
jgi:DNA-directed RNA polymerase specialized sigma24 family protein